MASLVRTVTETLRYKGAIGQWSWVLHRLTGLGVVLFLFIHVIDTAWAVTDPAGYVKAIATYQTPLFTIGEFGLVFAVVYHALNGLRIAIMDFRPELWKHQGKAAWWVLGGTALILVPFFVLMMGHVIEFYGHDPEILPLSEVLAEQLQFGVFAVGGIVAAAVIAFLWSALRLNVQDDAGQVRVRKNGATMRRIEKFSWSFMRISGVLIIPLIFGHLAMMHVLQGVFDLTAAGSPVTGTAIVEGVPDDALITMDNTAVVAEDVEEGTTVSQTIIIPNGINDSGTAVEFVAERWNFLWNGIAVWKIYDMLLLILVTVHGFNGLRLVLTDYTMDSRLMRTGAIALTVISALALLFIGLQALWLSINMEMMEMAIEATRNLH